MTTNMNYNIDVINYMYSRRLSLKGNVKVIWHIENKMCLVILGKQRLFTVHTHSEFIYFG